MGANFIYVFSSDARDKMLASGFVLLKEDTDNSVFIFKADSTLTFALGDASFVMSDTLSF